MDSIQTSHDHETDNSSVLVQAIFDKSLVGLLVLDQDTVCLANPAACQLLGLDPSERYQVLRIDGPDGLLVERLAEAAQTSNAAIIDYRMPVAGGAPESTLRFQVVPFEADKLLVKIDNVTAERQFEASWEKAVSNAFHELKTPLAVFSLGLSNLSTYYERFTDDQRRSMIDDLAAEGDEMTAILAKLFGQMRNIRRSTTYPDTQDS